MNKGFIIRASIIIAVCASIVIAAVSCDFMAARSEVVAPISNPDSVFLTLDDGVNVTYQELWDVMKHVEGIPYLEEYVDTILLADYIALVDQDDVDREIIMLKYLTDDEDIIAEIQADAELHQEYLETFDQNIRLLGFDPDSNESLTEFVTLGIAKMKYVQNKVMTAVEGDEFFISDDMLELFYDEENRGTACSFELRFSNSVEATKVFDHFNLVASYTDEDGNHGIGLYDPALNLDSEDNPKPIGDVSKADFNDTNTELLSENEVFSYYIKVWNYINPWETPISEGETQLSFCTNQADIAFKDYSEMVDGKASNDPYVKLANYLFVTVDLDAQGIIPYTYSHSNVYGEFMIMTYKISQTPAPEFSTLDDTEKLALKQEIAEQLSSDAIISAVIEDLRVENDFTIYDPFFRLTLDYQAKTQGTEVTYILNDDGNKEYIASIGETMITPDDLFDYMMSRVGAQYGIELAKIKVLNASGYFTETFGSDRNVLESDNENLVELRDVDLANIEEAFLNGAYVQQYGFDPATMDLDEFIYLAFNVRTTEEVLANVFVVRDLKTEFIIDTIIYDSTVAHMQDQVDRYVSLNATHLLLYVDRDGDLSPDDYSDFLATLSPAEVDEYNLMVTALEDAIMTELNDDTKSFSTIVLDYKNAPLDGTSEWAEFKEYGLFITTQALGEIHQNNIENYDEDFGNEIVRLYELYNESTEIDKTFLLADRLVETDFGIHLVRVTKGTSFDMASAMFAYGDDDEEVGYYVDGVENTSHVPNQAQVEAWMLIQVETAKGLDPSVKLPENVTAAIEYYFQPVFNVYVGTSGFGIAMADYMIDHNVDFVQNADLADVLEDMLNAYYDVSFPELFERNPE